MQVWAVANGSAPVFGCAGLCNVEFFADALCTAPVAASVEAVFDREHQQLARTAAFGSPVVYGEDA